LKRKKRTRKRTKTTVGIEEQVVETKDVSSEDS
jgi:hypothetical protein